MKRFDLRHLEDDFYERMVAILEKETAVGEVAIFLFEVGDFSSIQKSADAIKESGHELMNSLKFNEVDWTIVVKKLDAKTQKERQAQYQAAQAQAQAAAAEEEEK